MSTADPPWILAYTGHRWVTFSSSGIHLRLLWLSPSGKCVERLCSAMSSQSAAWQNVEVPWAPQRGQSMPLAQHVAGFSCPRGQLMRGVMGFTV